MWRIVLEGNQQLSEVNTWDLPTIWNANQMLDMKADTQAAYMEASQPENTKGD